ncbi:hypothetical protein B0H19DRAFT_1072705 [Mycena capillaripes]|nr:hypothetical protein B0H19DRAFT_1072705 [Mycena capillaripes]
MCCIWEGNERIAMLHSIPSEQIMIADPGVRLTSEGFLSRHLKGMPQKVGFLLESGFLSRIIPNTRLKTTIPGTVVPKLLKVVRHELDPGSRDDVFAAQRETRRTEGNTAEEAVTVFMNVFRKPCTAVDALGRKCDGKPILKPKPQGRSHGHQHVVACNGWKPKCQGTHLNFSILRNVDDYLLAKALNAESMTNDLCKDTKPCSCIVHLHIGGKQKYCHEKSDGQTTIYHHACPSRCTYFVPMDRNIRRLIVFHPGPIPHNHPMPPVLKMAHEAKDKYRASVDAVGAVGAIVAKVDNGTCKVIIAAWDSEYSTVAPSTKIIFDGQTLTKYSPALHLKRIKRDIVAKQKKKRANGGAYNFYLFPDFTDDTGVEAPEDDTTCKRIAGDLNEWEVVIFYKAIQRAINLARAYIDRANTDFFWLLLTQNQDKGDRPVKGFKILVSADEFCQLKDFISQSNILPEHWDRTPATTNTGEAQHHWTNSLTGIGLPLVDGLETLDSARIVDRRVVKEVQASIKTGVLANSNNEMSHRMQRCITRLHARHLQPEGEDEDGSDQGCWTVALLSILARSPWL